MGLINRIMFDTEFMEGGYGMPIIPLSIGMVNQQTGATLYLENGSASLSRANLWVVDNVFPYLKGYLGDRRLNYLNPTAPEVKPITQWKTEIVNFVGSDPEFWAYYSAYDWVVLCSVMGKMSELPVTWPMYCWDIKLLAQDLGITSEELHSECDSVNDNQHNALSDAFWNVRAWEYLKEI